ncbi:hypothetical protein [Falsigemmobacter faecalis]|uniref:Uncharacterized protein n=1 Tax=Falsigemmobacter faecalis TaxID=2488730 RepID=A0A3P3DCY0_9RHOB|nr:hypothetical protein [Falsigemmobacter faecalis]RRH71292.1 hypothetical protein EG244_16590 [Falsigemmobacter faecalis]
MPESKRKGFDPEIAKLIAAFAVAAQRIELDDDLAEALFQTALEIYNGTEARARVERYDA